ncbi:MAG: autotransporter assembly complex protein TamA [Wenzhouxiangella sp.]
MIRNSAMLGIFILSVLATVARADTVVTEISGVDGQLLTNVRAHLSLVRAERLGEVSEWRLRQMATDARDEVRQALRPFGFYRPRIDVRLDEPVGPGAPWRARINIVPGEPVRVEEVQIEFSGDGEQDEALLSWRDDWPLTEGDRFRHAEYDEAWRDLTDLALARGYFEGTFRERRVTVDPDRSSARIRIHFDTGRRYVFGEYRAPQDTFSERLVDRLTIVQPGEPFTSARLDEQREALVRSGLFDRIAVEEERDREEGRIDLTYYLEPRPPNTYRITGGFGTDTGARVQLAWIRHYLSSRGNRLDSGLAAQQRNNEFILRSEYQHPRGNKPSDFWTGGVTLRREQDNFRFRDEQREAVFDAFSGRREQAEITIGRLQERRFLPDYFGPLEERVFIAGLNESFNAFREATFSQENEDLLAANPELAPLLETSTNTLALGARWRLPAIRGSGFSAQGHVFQAHLLASHESAGSDVSFAQAYLSGRWHRVLADRHKFLLRGEIGYTDADTRSIDVELDDRELRLSVTELPELYRFHTGGDRTVRGYGYETLSTNRNGANHILTGSAEYELRVTENWSVATFYDIGNAFNSWGSLELKRGVGAGVRWYTLIGPIQIDFARALDDIDQPWRLHLTIGTRLL